MNLELLRKGAECLPDNLKVLCTREIRALSFLLKRRPDHACYPTYYSHFHQFEAYWYRHDVKAVLTSLAKELCKKIVSILSAHKEPSFTDKFRICAKNVFLFKPDQPVLCLTVEVLKNVEGRKPSITILRDLTSLHQNELTTHKLKENMFAIVDFTGERETCIEMSSWLLGIPYNEARDLIAEDVAPC